MRFFDMLTQMIGLLVLERRVSYRTLKLLAPICGWFTEGFDNTDLQEAKELLKELA